MTSPVLQNEKLNIRPSTIFPVCQPSVFQVPSVKKQQQMFLFSWFRSPPPAPELRLVDHTETSATIKISLPNYTCSEYKVEVHDPSIPIQGMDPKAKDKPKPNPTCVVEKAQPSATFVFQNLKFNHSYEIKGSAMVNNTWTPFSEALVVQTDDLSIDATLEDCGFDWILLTVSIRKDGDTKFQIEEIESKCIDVTGVIKEDRTKSLSSDNSHRISQLEPGKRYTVEVKAKINGKFTTHSTIHCKTPTSMFPCCCDFQYFWHVNNQ